MSLESQFDISFPILMERVSQGNFGLNIVLSSENSCFLNQVCDCHFKSRKRSRVKVCLHVTDFSPFYGKWAVLGCSHLQYFVPFFSPCFLCLHVLNKAPFTPRGIVFIDLVSCASI